MIEYNKKEFDAKPYLDARDIEYKKVDVDDFIECNYQVNEIAISLDSAGFATDDLYNKIDITFSSTEVINIPTGSGKTTAIYSKIKQILEEDESGIIILATPFIALVAKDFNYLTTEYKIDSAIITDYRELKKDMDKSHSYSFIDPINMAYINNKRIHITTINALLRNPGDVAFEQKLIKTNYFIQLLDYCEKHNKHVYLFLDEIHASIHNFKNEYIHNLTMWKSVIHKCIVSTATYTEPVNIVVKHLAYLTNDNINVIECDRVKKIKVSPLDLLFLPETYNTKNAYSVIYFLRYWIKYNLNKGSYFHILSYSKKFAKEVCLQLKNVYTNTQLLTSETNNTFNHKMNNIGTNFSTGVDIKNNNDLLIVIFPSKYSDEMVKGEEGIFYDGLPTILQAVARLRAKGRVLFIVSPMKSIIDDDNTKALINNVPFYSNSDTPFNKNIYSFEKETYLKDEKAVLKDFLDRTKTKHSKEKARYVDDIANDHVIRPKIEYADNATFILERGQEYLKYKSNKSGKYITPYVLWGAVHDQFLNCSLDKVYYLERNIINLYLTSENLTHELYNYLGEGFEKIAFKGFNIYYGAFMEALVIKKDVKVKVYLNGKAIRTNQLKSNTKLYFGLVDSYFKFRHCEEQIIDAKTYIEYMIRYYDYDYDINIIKPEDYYNTYKKLLEIISTFIARYIGKAYTANEITKLPFFTDEIVDTILNIHKLLKERDQVLNTLSKIGSFWELKAKESAKLRSSVINNFMDNYIVKGDVMGKDKRRPILGSILEVEKCT